MAIAAPSVDVIRLLEALGLRPNVTREVTLRMAVNEVVAVSTVEYASGESVDALAGELRERQYRLSRWIPVEERLPDATEEVLALTPSGYRVAWVTHRGHWHGYWLPLLDVTHWMPLPEPPEAK